MANFGVLTDVTLEKEIVVRSAGKTSVCNVSVKEVYTMNKEEKVRYHNFVAWGKKAESLRANVGDTLWIRYRLSTTKKEGDKYWTPELVIEDMIAVSPAVAGSAPDLVNDVEPF